MKRDVFASRLIQPHRRTWNGVPYHASQESNATANTNGSEEGFADPRGDTPDPDADRWWEQRRGRGLIRVRPDADACVGVVVHPHEAPFATSSAVMRTEHGTTRDKGTSRRVWFTWYLPLCVVSVIVLYVVSELVIKILAMRTVHTLARQLPEIPTSTPVTINATTQGARLETPMQHAAPPTPVAPSQPPPKVHRSPPSMSSLRSFLLPAAAVCE